MTAPKSAKTASKTLPTTFLFIAENRHSPTKDQQIEACYSDGDTIIEAGDLAFSSLAAKLARAGSPLQVGDTIKVYDLTSFALSTKTLIATVCKTLKLGVSVEIASLDLTLRHDDPKGEAVRLLTALDAHWRHLHGLKITQAHEARPGRKALLSPDQLEEIEEALKVEGATVTSVARDFGVGRSTMHDFLKKYRNEEVTA